MPSKEDPNSSTFLSATTQENNSSPRHHFQNAAVVEDITSVQGMKPRDVDELVNEIKLNLRLKGATTSMECSSGSSEREFDVPTPANMSTFVLNTNYCSNNNNNNGGGNILVRTKLRSSNRLAPYYVPSRSETVSECHSCGSPRCLRTCLRQPKSNSSDPYQLLQELLKEGGLIKEAVRRLTVTESPAVKYYDYENDEYENSGNNTLIGLEA